MKKSERRAARARLDRYESLGERTQFAPADSGELPRPAEVLQFPVEAVRQQPEGTHLVPCCYCHRDRWCVRKAK